MMKNNETENGKNNIPDTEVNKYTENKIQDPDDLKIDKKIETDSERDPEGIC